MTLTPSPVVDRVYFFEDMVPGTVNRALTVEQYLGGNGINVARTLQLAGNITRAVAPAPNPSGLELVRREGELIRTVLVSPPTRVNTVLVSSDGSTTNANRKPGLLPEAGLRSVCEATLDELRTLAGSGGSLAQDNRREPSGSSVATSPGPGARNQSMSRCQRCRTGALGYERHG
ncbi:hypothetical protein [Arthrobacter sp. 4R501]|uniref:hypothetical protein n=1 Tax=Arthrobacter sp. 4R501 TaxID=2058886 RepID=UPI0011B0F26B|nr:hypothetical protein [Arthrobacter sp. 4R501]